jgi:chemotaxis protein methyltransferase CheR
MVAKMNQQQGVLELRDIEFEKISRLVHSQCGINLHDGKKELVKARLGKRLREGNFSSFKDYYQHVTSADGTDELISMIDSLSTNLTFFFREESHFHALSRIASACFSEAREARRPARLRLWSAGCSTGEEPYSLAMTVRECAGDAGADIQIVATDISTRVLGTAVKGIFTQEKLKNIPPAMLRRYFQIGSGSSEGYYRIKEEIREMVRFSRFNLMAAPPSAFVFDIIFCRNVLIYFDKETQGALIRRFYQCLNKGGYFFAGHSESLTGLDHDFKYLEPSIYRK